MPAAPSTSSPQILVSSHRCSQQTTSFATSGRRCGRQCFSKPLAVLLPTACRIRYKRPPALLRGEAGGSTISSQPCSHRRQRCSNGLRRWYKRPPALVRTEPEMLQSLASLAPIGGSAAPTACRVGTSSRWRWCEQRPEVLQSLASLAPIGGSSALTACGVGTTVQAAVGAATSRGRSCYIP
jgi:hypothetical protein